MSRARALAACLAGLLLCGTPAFGYWNGTGSGSGTAVSDTIPAGLQPTVSAAGQAVTVTWSQSTFRSQAMGAYAGGGYMVTRQPAAGGAAVTPGGTCATTVSGSAATLTCQDPAVPAGAWTYTVTPVLMTWTGGASPRSGAVSTVPVTTQSAPVAQNPTVAQTTGDVRVSWSAVTGASGYNVYRRTTSGSYDYAAPLNGGTPLTGTSFTDPGGGLAAGTGYAYVVRTIGGTPGAESPNSNEQSVTPVSRPSAPGGVAAAPAAAARVSVTWSAVAGASGYNVYRRTAAGSYNYAAPLNGATPVSSASYTDTTSVNGTSYAYVVRALVVGGAGAQVESASSAESALVTADSVAPATPTSVTVGAGAGPLQPTTTCGIAAGTRFVNAAGDAAVPVTIALPAVEAGETLSLSATTPGSTPVTATVAAAASVTTSLDLQSLADGTVTLTVRAADQAGNASAAKSPTTATVMDTVALLGSLVYTDAAKGTADTIAGSSECGARITAVQTAGPNVGAAYPASGTVTVGSAGTFTNFAVAAIRGGAGTAFAYDVTATDLAANAATVSLAGSDAN